MNKVFVQTDIELVDPVILTTELGDYSMPYVAGLMSWLEKNGAIIQDQSYRSERFGNLVESGIEVKFESVTFLFTCSYDNFIIKRLSGKKVNFWGLCELFKGTEL